ncbi:response regulator [Candidatus Peregrinibacteria bacterium]|nr:response regulator [Candidatus Peregrinibacteria bacterium]
MIKKILVVDTDRDVMEFLRGHLDAPNIYIHTSLGGAEAVETLNQRPFDLVIAALEMPHPNGIDLLVELNSKGQTVPFIFLSKLFQDNTEVRKRLGDIGPYTLLDKPLFMNRLYEAIEAQLQFKINWEERRLSGRYPIRLDMQVMFGTPTGTIISERAPTLDFSLSGVSYQRKVCEVCTGYEKGSVHKDCVMYPHSYQNPAGKIVNVIITLPDGESLVMKGKFVRTIIEDGKYTEMTNEYIGIRFIDMDAHQFDKIRFLLKKYLKP